VSSPIPAGSRILLRRLRDIMAGTHAAQAKLDRIVTVVASNMVAEVCSIYLRRAGEVLELFATEGLNPEAKHATRLRFGEGIIGDVAANARPLNLPDAPSHPNFAFRPETGEERYHSMLGVPILRGGRVVGVIAVQNRTNRDYSEEELESLQTVAMVLAELAGSRDLVEQEELQVAVEATLGQALRLDGVVLAEGLAKGVAVLHEPRIVIVKSLSDDPAVEKRRLASGLAALKAEIDDMLTHSDVAGAGEHRDVLEAYQMFALDRGWARKIEAAIETGLTAEAAVERVQIETHRRMAAVTDHYLRERQHDFDDLAHRLQRHLAGKPRTAAAENLPDDAILIARTMGPAELLDYDRRKLKAVVLEEGSPNAHVAIVARALDIPVVGRVAGIVDRAETGDPVVVDGHRGEVIVRPGEDVLQTFTEHLAARDQLRELYAQLKDQPAITRDGLRVSLNLNAGLSLDLAHLPATGADGVGLYRTELYFMLRAALPDVEMQTQLYTQVLDQAGDRPVVFRTLDVGGDKVLPYQEHEAEENPAMGWRAIRIGLDRPVLLRQQLRALLQAGAGRRLDIMFPMIAEVAEFRAAKNILMNEAKRAATRGTAMPKLLRVGTMLEVPSLAHQMAALLPLVDFVSIGSNDLMQFLFASDRGNPRLAGRYDPLSPAMLTLIRNVARECAGAKVPLAVCGEMAGHPIEAMALIGVGVTHLSMSATAIGPVKMMARTLDAGALGRYMARLLERPDHSLRGRLMNFAQDHGIAV
jgi:phosphotransferase system, enzyme I, PtsP